MKKKELRANAISVERFLRNYCFLMPYSELLGLETEAYTILDMYRIIDNKAFDNLRNANIKTLRMQLMDLGIKTRGANFDDINVCDILVGNVIVVSDHHGNIFAFDWSIHNELFNSEFCEEKTLKLKRSEKNGKRKRK